MFDVVVTCLPHGDEIAIFPQVRGYYLAKHLAASGLRAEFRQLPLPGLRCKVLICSEYQSHPGYFRERLEPLLRQVEADRMYCLIAHSIKRVDHHFSQYHCEWFATHGGGGALVHLPAWEWEEYEQWIGVGIDRDVVHVPRDHDRRRVLFDWPKAPGVQDAADNFRPHMIAAVREALPHCVVVGSGPADSPLRTEFDDWVPYGQPHATYTRAALAGVFAFVPGWGESMGLPIAEAQVTGACIVASEDRAPQWMLCPEADVPYVEGDAASLVAALTEARQRDQALIRGQAAVRFDYYAVAKRTRQAIGL